VQRYSGVGGAVESLLSEKFVRDVVTSVGIGKSGHVTIRRIVRFQSLSGFAGYSVSVTVVSREISSVPLVQIFFRMRIVSVVVVLLRMMRLGISLLISLWWILLRLAVVSSRDVSISSDHLAIRMLNVP